VSDMLSIRNQILYGSSNMTAYGIQRGSVGDTVAMQVVEVF